MGTLLRRKHFVILGLCRLPVQWWIGYTSTHGEYVRAKGLDNSVFKELILELLRVRPCSRAEIIAELDHALPADLTPKQKGDHVSYLLQSLRKAGRITNAGSTSAAEWRIVD